MVPDRCVLGIDPLIIFCMVWGEIRAKGAPFYLKSRALSF